jgi:hypothetical protein
MMIYFSKFLINAYIFWNESWWRDTQKRSVWRREGEALGATGERRRAEGEAERLTTVDVACQHCFA